MSEKKVKRKKSSSSKHVAKKTPFIKKNWFVFICGLVVGLVISPILGGGTSTSQKEKNSTVVTKKEKESNTKVSSETIESAENKETGDFVSKASEAYFDGEMLRGNTYSIKITDYKVIPAGQKGNEYSDNSVIAFWYDTIVSPDYNDDKKIDPTSAWIFNFSVVQDNDKNKVNKVNVASLPDDKFRDSQLAEIKPGGTVSNAVSYELTDDTTPVNLIAESFGTEFGSKEFSIK